MGCRSGCSRSQERAEGVGAAGRAEGGGRARVGRGEPSVAGWGWEPRRRRGWLEELRFPPRLPGWRQAAGGQSAAPWQQGSHQGTMGSKSQADCCPPSQLR